MKLPRRARGFTLIEVMVALVIVAFGVSSALAALNSAADNASRLRDRSCAQWIGFNQLATVRLTLQAPTVGTTTGDLDYASSHWQWQQKIEESSDLPGVQRLTVKVRRTGAMGSSAAAAPAADTQWLATTIGFRGTAVSAASGEQPDWNGARAGVGPGGGARTTPGNDPGATPGTGTVTPPGTGPVTPPPGTNPGTPPGTSPVTPPTTGPGMPPGTGSGIPPGTGPGAPVPGGGGQP